MASSHEIEVIITPDGQVKLDVRGFKGPGCLLGVKKLADAVGTLVEQTTTPEYYEQAAQSQTQTQKNP